MQNTPLPQSMGKHHVSAVREYIDAGGSLGDAIKTWECDPEMCRLGSLLDSYRSALMYYPDGAVPSVHLMENMGARYGISTAAEFRSAVDRLALILDEGASQGRPRFSGYDILIPAIQAYAEALSAAESARCRLVNAASVTECDGWGFQSYAYRD